MDDYDKDNRYERNNSCDRDDSCGSCGSEASHEKYNELYEVHLKILKEVKDKSLVISVLCSKSCTLFSRIRSFINIPLILSSGAMTILNSMNDADSGTIKYTNIIINSITATILSLVGNFKLAEREVTYKQTHKRMKNMYHQVDIILRAEPGKINAVSVGNITKEYVNIYELLEYPIPYFVIRQFNKELETEAVAKRNRATKAMKAKQAMQATREKQAMQMNQEEQSLQVDYNDVLFNGELTFANNFMNQGTFQTV
jgi:hypothetical protein